MKIMELYKQLPNVDLYSVKWARLQGIIALSEKPIGRYLDPSLSANDQIEILSRIVNIKRLEKWRVGWLPDWMEFNVWNFDEILKLGEESYESWKQWFKEENL